MLRIVSSLLGTKADRLSRAQDRCAVLPRSVRLQTSWRAGGESRGNCFGNSETAACACFALCATILKLRPELALEVLVQGMALESWARRFRCDRRRGAGEVGGKSDVGVCLPEGRRLEGVIAIAIGAIVDLRCERLGGRLRTKGRRGRETDSAF